MNTNFTYTSCNFCPRNCRINRELTEGYCKSPAHPFAARAALHPWEEPCILGTRGSGTIFFSGCNLRCVFCQNFNISQEGFGKAIDATRLSKIFFELEAQGAHNINLVTPTQYLPTILEALADAKPRLSIPIVYNCGGYEKTEVVEALSDYVDIWLPDLKYHSSELSRRYSGAEDYFSVASAAIQTMIARTGAPEFTPDGLLRKGVILRHMVLPGQKADSIRLLQWMAKELPKESFLLSLMSQYTPFYKASEYPEIHRRITSYEYQKVVDTAIELGLTHGFMQEKSSAKEEYTPPFALQGL